MPYGWARKSKEQPNEEDPDFKQGFVEWIQRQNQEIAEHLLGSMGPADDAEQLELQQQKASVIAALLISYNFLERAMTESHLHVDQLVIAPDGTPQSNSLLAGSAFLHGQIDAANFLLFKLLKAFRADITNVEFSRSFDELFCAQD